MSSDLTIKQLEYLEKLPKLQEQPLKKIGKLIMPLQDNRYNIQKILSQLTVSFQKIVNL